MNQGGQVSTTLEAYNLSDSTLDGGSRFDKLSPMAASVKSSSRKSGDREAMPFEAALRKLESIVEAMEEGDLPLESLLEQYEQGTGLVKTCQAKLEEAELKIKKLEKNADGELVLNPMETESIEQDT